MNKYCFILILGTLVLVQSNAQSFSDTLYFDSSNRLIDTIDRHGYYRVISRDTINSFHFLVKEFFMNDTLKMIGSFKSINPDRKNGIFRYYFSNGVLKKECTYKQDRLYGTYRTWYSTGQLKENKYFKDNKIHGNNSAWYLSGLLKKDANYSEGIKNGEFNTYYQNGNSLRKEIYKKGLRIKEKCFASTGEDTAYFEYFRAPLFKEGTISKFTSWIIENIDYPLKEEIISKEVKILIKFKLNKFGVIENVKILDNPDSTFGTELIRLFKNSSGWKPAMQDFDSIDISIKIPMSFNQMN